MAAGSRHLVKTRVVCLPRGEDAERDQHDPKEENQQG
jgi:hypothetical protein